MKYHVWLILAALWLASCSGGRAPATPVAQVVCTPVARQADVVQTAIDAGAVVVYERVGAATCVDELWTFYPDGRIEGDNGHTTVEKTVTAEEISTLLTDIDELGFFDLTSTKHTACKECFAYHITVNHGDQVKTVSAVDGGTDTPGAYWQVFAKIKRLLPEFSEE